MATKCIHDLWSRGKMSTRDAKLQAIASRAMTSRKLIETIDWLAEQESHIEQDLSVSVVRHRVEKSMRPFHPSAEIDIFMTQFVDSLTAPKGRYRMLLLRGTSRSGKTAKACSLFGPMFTLVANCQGMSPDLPSIADFSRSTHHAIVWDEIDHWQILNNKKAFQAGVDPVTLGQSKCNAHAYRRWLHAVPMILCSNVFAWPEDADCDLSTEDADWLVKNIIVAPLPASQKWYVSGDSSDESE